MFRTCAVSFKEGIQMSFLGVAFVRCFWIRFGNLSMFCEGLCWWLFFPRKEAESSLKQPDKPCHIARKKPPWWHKGGEMTSNYYRNRRLQSSRCIRLVAVCKCNRTPFPSAMRCLRPRSHWEVCNIAPARGCALIKHHLPAPMVKKKHAHLPTISGSFRFKVKSR